MYRPYLAVLLAAGLLAGCAGPQTLRTSYTAYSEAFANANNTQLLLNLARLHNGHPPYFLQLGAVSARFNFNGGFSGGRTETDSAGPDVITKTLGLNLGASETPTFNFTPLRGKTVSNALMRRIPIEVMYNFTNQGLSLDVLMRAMLQEVMVEFPRKGIEVRLSNRFRPDDPENYLDFLRLAASLGSLQKADQLYAQSDRTDQDAIRIAIDPQTGAIGRGTLGAQYHLRSLGALPADAGEAVLHLLPRTFLGALSGMAFEEAAFSAIPEDRRAGLPASVREPVLKIEDDPAFTEPPAAEVTYAGKYYVVSDRPGEMGNRLAFMTLQFLANQIELDPGDLPTQQLIQVN